MVKVADEEFKSVASQVLDEHPDLRRVMAESEGFAELKSSSYLDEVAGRPVYLVNDTQGDEEALYIDALAKGVKGFRKGKSNDVYGRLFLELDDRLKAIVEEKIAGGDV